MSVFPEVNLGAPIQYESLSVFPISVVPSAKLDYVLADEAIQAGAVSVQEVDEGGSVPELMVTNTGDLPVLFLEGEELRGAKQNRVLNTSVLVAAHATLKIPVSCVESGRWRYLSRKFTHSGLHSSSKLRLILKKSVARSVKQSRQHRSDQGEVWREVGRQMASLGSVSETAAMSDTFDSYRDRMVEFQQSLPYVEGATGLAVAIGSRVVSVDLFDRPETCQKVWSRLLSGLVLDALESKSNDPPADASQVQSLLNRLQESGWAPAPTVGAGQEFRAEADDQTHASALVCDDSLLHGSVVVGA